MSFGLGDFYRNAVEKDFSRDFQLRVLKMANGIIEPNDNVFITTATLPGYQINNQTLPYMGLQFNIPGTAQFPGSAGWQVLFRSDAQLNIRQKFINWQSSIFNAFPNGAGQTTPRNTGAYSPVPDSTTIQIYVQNRDGSVARGFELCGAYPVTVGDMNYTQEGSGAVVTFTATLAYQWWRPSAIESPGAGA